MVTPAPQGPVWTWAAGGVWLGADPRGHPRWDRRLGGTINYEDWCPWLGAVWPPAVTTRLIYSWDLRQGTQLQPLVQLLASFHPQLCCCRPVNYQYLISVLIFGIINVLLHNYILRTNEWISSNTYLQFSTDNSLCQSAPVSCCVLFGKYSFDMVAQTFWRLSRWCQWYSWRGTWPYNTLAEEGSLLDSSGKGWGLLGKDWGYFFCIHPG